MSLSYCHVVPANTRTDLVSTDGFLRSPAKYESVFYVGCMIASQQLINGAAVEPRFDHQAYINRISRVRKIVYLVVAIGRVMILQYHTQFCISWLLYLFARNLKIQFTL